MCAILFKITLITIISQIIDGILEFQNGPEIDRSLQAVYIELRGGTLRIGSEENRFEGKATITLHGDRKTPFITKGTESILLGAKVIFILKSYYKEYNVITFYFINTDAWGIR